MKCIAKQEVTHVHSIDVPIGWNPRSCRQQKRCECIDLMHHFVAHLAGRQLARPSDGADPNYRIPAMDPDPELRDVKENVRYGPNIIRTCGD
jgi:hypothetical protein